MDLKLNSKNKLIILGGLAAFSLTAALFLWKRKKNSPNSSEHQLLDAKDLLKICDEVRKRIEGKLLQLIRSHRLERRKLLTDIPNYVEACKRFESSCYELLEITQYEYLDTQNISRHRFDISVKAALESKEPSEAEIAFKQQFSHTISIYLNMMIPSKNITMQEVKEMIQNRAEFFKTQSSHVIAKIPQQLTSKATQYVIDNLANDYTWEKTNLEFEDLAPLIKANMQVVVASIQKETNNNNDLTKKIAHGLQWPTP